MYNCSNYFLSMSLGFSEKFYLVHFHSFLFVYKLNKDDSVQSKVAWYKDPLTKLLGLGWISDFWLITYSRYCSSKKYNIIRVRPSICNLHGLLLTYCYSTKNLRNYSFVSLCKGIFLFNIKD